MKRPRRKYSRTPGAFYPKRWSEEIAMKLTKVRLSKIDGLLIEIAGMWGDVDEGICGECDELRGHLEEARARIIDGHAELAEQRRLDRQEADAS